MMQLFDLSGKKAMITGASGGLGLGIARALHGAGAEVCLISYSPGALDRAAELSAAGAPAHAILADLTDHGSLEQNFQKALAELGGQVDILVNNAGHQHVCPAEDFPEEDFDRVVGINLKTMYMLCQKVGRLMLQNGYGKIINIASLNSFVTAQKISAYAASKGGVAQLTKALANEWGGRGVRVNAIAPGYMKTKLTSFIDDDPERLSLINARIPLERWGQPEDLAGPAVFLASAASDYMTGVVMPVDGGYLAR